MNIVFAGTPEFAVPSLMALIHSRHSVVGVYTQPDRPAGRGRHLQASPVKQAALTHQIPVYQPISLKSDEERDRLSAMQVDVMVVVAYGLLLPQKILDIPKHGCINVHASLLPRWRGAAPIQRAVMAGDEESGVCIMKMEAGLDTGPVFLCEKTPIAAQDTAGDLHDQLATLGANALLTVITDIEQGTAIAIEQDHAAANYAKKISKSEAFLNFTSSAIEAWRVIKAFSPWPIAYAHLAGKTIRIHRAEVLDATSQQLPGTIVDVSANGIDVACENGLLRLTTIQLPGAKVLSVAEVLRGHSALFAKGMRFEAA